MLLIHPPIAKPCEPPPGIAKLAGTLRQNSVECTVLDANVEGVLGLMEGTFSSPDRWTSRAVRNRASNLSALRSPATYENLDRYKRAVLDLNRLVEISHASQSVRLSLANYQHDSLSPARSEDLLCAAQFPERNPFYSYFVERISDIMQRENHTVVGLSLNFLSQALSTFAMLGFLRRTYPQVRLVLGGGLITSWMRRPGWKNPFSRVVAHTVAGPGESDLLAIAGVNTTEKAECSRPDYGGLPRDRYLAPGLILPYSASSGCYWGKCSFCPERAEGNTYSPVPTHAAMNDIRTLVDETKPVLLHLLDNALSPSLMKALCKHPPGVPWYGFSRVTQHLADADFCTALKKSGCVMLKLGLESGDQKVLDGEQKGMNIELAARALSALRQAGISTYVYLLFGTPSETLVEARKTLEFTVKHSENIDFLNLAIFNLPVNGGEDHRFTQQMHYDGDLCLYTGFAHPGGWNRGLVRQFLDKEFKRHPAISRILKNDPPIFTSNHAPFFCTGIQQ